jgi:hypothetical protein
VFIKRMKKYDLENDDPRAKVSITAIELRTFNGTLGFPKTVTCKMCNINTRKLKTFKIRTNLPSGIPCD